MQALWLFITGVAGAALGFWLKSVLAKSARTFVEQDNGKLLAESRELKEALAKAKAESESRAGFAGSCRRTAGCNQPA